MSKITSYPAAHQPFPALFELEPVAGKREKEAYPIIRDFEKWMGSVASLFSSKSRIGRAIAYTYALLPRLSRYVLDGRYNIDNNGVENAIRPLAIGRKNYLFCGNHDAAVRAAIISTPSSPAARHTILKYGLGWKTLSRDFLPKRTSRCCFLKSGSKVTVTDRHLKRLARNNIKVAATSGSCCHCFIIVP